MCDVGPVSNIFVRVPGEFADRAHSLRDAPECRETRGCRVPTIDSKAVVSTYLSRGNPSNLYSIYRIRLRKLTFAKKNLPL